MSAYIGKGTLASTVIVACCAAIVFFCDYFYPSEEIIIGYRLITVYFIWLTIYFVSQCYRNVMIYIKSRSYNPQHFQTPLLPLEKEPSQPTTTSSDDFFDIG